MSSDDTLLATALATIVNTMTKVFIFTSYPGKTKVHAQRVLHQLAAIAEMLDGNAN